MHQVGDQPRLYYDALPTNHQDQNLCSCPLTGSIHRFKIQNKFTEKKKEVLERVDLLSALDPVM